MNEILRIAVSAAARADDTRIDLFVTEPFDFDHEYGHALAGNLAPGLRLRFVRLDPLIRMKETAGREVQAVDLLAAPESEQP